MGEVLSMCHRNIGDLSKFYVLQITDTKPTDEENYVPKNVQNAAVNLNDASFKNR